MHTNPHANDGSAPLSRRAEVSSTVIHHGLTIKSLRRCHRIVLKRANLILKGYSFTIYLYPLADLGVGVGGDGALLNAL